MSYVIHKFPIDPALGGDVWLPRGALFLDLQVQRNVPVLWFVVPAENLPDEVMLQFTVVGTGQRFDQGQFAEYIKTFQLGAFVGHVWCHQKVDRVQSS